MLTDRQNRTTILGYEFDSPFFISPAAKAEYGHPDAEWNILQGAASANILYIVRCHHAFSIDQLAKIETRD